MRGIGLCALVIAAFGCSAAKTDSPPAPAAAAAASSSRSDTVLAPVLAVDLEGRPLPNLLPIATEQPNALDKPLIQGELTGADGRSTMRLPRDKYLYARVWDPTLRMFANNYFDVQPGDAAETELLTVVMVPSASVQATLLGPDGAPAANLRAGLLLIHPQKGPWWPEEADSDADGTLRCPHVPAGKFTVRFKALNVGEAEMTEVVLLPGTKTDLGVIALH